jgi:hypothetical protein
MGSSREDVNRRETADRRRARKHPENTAGLNGPQASVALPGLRARLDGDSRSVDAAGQESRLEEAEKGFSAQHA